MTTRIRNACIVILALVFVGCGTGGSGTTVASDPQATTSDPSVTSVDATVATTAPATTAPATTPPATTSAPERVVLATGGVTTATAAYYIGILGGFFEDQGLEVEIEAAGGNAAALVVSGQADLGALGLPAAVTPIREGRQTRVIFGYLNTPISFIIGNPDVEDAAQCESVTTTYAGSQPYAEAILFQDALGASWDLAPLTDTPSVPNLVVSSQADCAVASYSVVGGAIREERVNVLLDPSDTSQLPDGFPRAHGAALYGLEETLEERRDVIIGFLAGLLQAYDLIERSEPSELAEMLREHPDWAGQAQEQLTAQIEVEKPIVMQPVEGGYITEEMWQDDLGFLVASEVTFVDPDDEIWGYENVVDMSFYDSAVSR